MPTHTLDEIARNVLLQRGAPGTAANLQAIKNALENNPSLLDQVQGRFRQVRPGEALDQGVTQTPIVFRDAFDDALERAVAGGDVVSPVQTATSAPAGTPAPPIIPVEQQELPSPAPPVVPVQQQALDQGAAAPEAASDGGFFDYIMSLFDDTGIPPIPLPLPARTPPRSAAGAQVAREARTNVQATPQQGRATAPQAAAAPPRAPGPARAVAGTTQRARATTVQEAQPSGQRPPVVGEPSPERTAQRAARGPQQKPRVRGRSRSVAEDVSAVVDEQDAASRPVTHEQTESGRTRARVQMDGREYIVHDNGVIEYPEGQMFVRQPALIERIRAFLKAHGSKLADAVRVF